MSETKPKFSEQGLYAFPHAVAGPDGKGGTVVQVCVGMTLRDYFAGQALAGACARHGLDVMRPDEVASSAYRMADLMLAARSAKS